MPPTNRLRRLLFNNMNSPVAVIAYCERWGIELTPRERKHLEIMLEGG